MTTTELAHVPRPLPASPRILLAGVFGPFGVDDAFGRRDNVMELFHNQVTKAQGLASFRYHHRSFGLYFLAENVDADVTVLDFPSRRRFEREVARGQYDVIGISFIAPNFLKAREMARIVRRRSPRSIILLGGHGAAIEGIEREIDCDHVVRGEGIRWLRGFLGQDPDAPIRHPVLPSTERQTIFGIPVPGPTSGLLVPGVGCVNACKFCSTSHFFGKAYTPFLGTGAEVFAAACSVGDARGSDDFFVMDENFLKDRARAVELLRLQEERGRFFNLQVFSSAEAVTALSVEQLVRLGIEFVWIGVESSSEEGNFEKNAGIDPRPLIRELDHGVTCSPRDPLPGSTMPPPASTGDRLPGGAQADFVQFMLLTPLPPRASIGAQARGCCVASEYEDWHGRVTSPTGTRISPKASPASGSIGRSPRSTASTRARCIGSWRRPGAGTRRSAPRGVTIPAGGLGRSTGVGRSSPGHRCSTSSSASPSTSWSACGYERCGRRSRPRSRRRPRSTRARGTPARSRWPASRRCAGAGSTTASSRERSARAIPPAAVR